MLYGAPVWAEAMAVAAYRRALQGVQRRIALRICRAYRTTSFEAATLVAGIVPIHLMAQERKRIWESPLTKEEAKKTEKEVTMGKWQREWENGQKGEWTRELIPEVEPWIKRNHGSTTYYLTQALTEHGAFRAYAKRIGKTADDKCMYCEEVDTPEPTIFVCDRWGEERRRVNITLEEPLSKRNMVAHMVTTEQGWRAIEKFVTTVMRKKEEDERR